MWWWPWSSRRGRSVQVKLIKMGGRLVRHARRLIFQLSSEGESDTGRSLPFLAFTILGTLGLVMSGMTGGDLVFDYGINVRAINPLLAQ